MHTPQELTKDQLGNTATVRENSQRFQEIVKISLDKIVIRENFNVRNSYGNIEELANSILENGQTIAGIVDVMANNTFCLVEGHRRFKALQYLQEQGHEGIFFKAVVNTQKTTEEQRILQMFTSQDNKQLEPYEVAELLKRLINLGYTQKSAAQKIGKTPAYISQMLSFANEPEAIKAMVREGKLTVNTALKTAAAIPNTAERIEKVKEAAENAKQGEKITTEKIAGKKPSPCAELMDLLMETLDYLEEQPANEESTTIAEKITKAINKHQNIYLKN